MSETPLNSSQSSSPEPSESEALERLSAAWGQPMQAVLCPVCDWSYALPAKASPGRCPRCFRAELVPLGEQIDQLPYNRPPEMVLPFTLNAATLASGIQSFAQGIPFPPDDLNAQTLRGRLRPVYLPMWLVDTEVQANWQAEAGYNYNVVSHQDRFAGGSWSSQEVQEGRVRWEPRLGKLTRVYQNVPAPALEDHARLSAALGDFDLASATPYRTELMEKACVRLPNRPPQDAWSDASPAFQAAAAQECRQATAADHIRQFAWQPQFKNQNWTLLLQPIYSTYYLDDEGQPQPVILHGQKGRVNGSRRASMKRATRASLSLLVAALVAFLISLVLLGASVVAPPVLIFGIVGMVIAFGLGLTAIYPVTAVWWFNRNKTGA